MIEATSTVPVTFSFAGGLVEEVVRHEMERSAGGAGGDARATLAGEYRRLLDGIYILSGEARLVAAQRIHQQFFGRLGWTEFFATEFRDILPMVTAAWVGKAERDEGCFVDERRRLQVRLRRTRFEDREGLARFLRHEKMHAADILDPEFGYRNETVDEPTRIRYATLWCTSIDERLKGASLEPVTHDGLLQRARSLSRPKCPLCSLPTVHWGEVRDAAMTDWLRGQFAGWSPDQGLCERCLEWAEVNAA
ncbi:MAG: hypothetical protein HYY93_10120 [Planctomycetes bacterium]|nr:hypothetical protein [Planctomycetota bacterium]